MTQPKRSTLLSLARQRQVDAINASLNYVIQKIEVKARAVIKEDLIEIIVEKTEGVPEQELSVKYIKKFLEYLKISAIHHVKIYAKQSGTYSLIWWSEFFLEGVTPQDDKFAGDEPTNISTAVTDRNFKQQRDIWRTPSVGLQLETPKPIPFEHLPNDLQKSIKRAGLRSGETRSWQDAKQMYEMMPENVRRQGAEAIRDYKQAHDWSHKRSYSNSGSNKPGNGDWEDFSTNRARGSRNMSPDEGRSIAQVKAKINFQSGAKIVWTQAVISGGIAFGVELAFSGLDNFLAVQRGEKSVEKALIDTLASSSSVAVVAGAITGGVVAISLAFPPVIAAVGVAVPFLQIVGISAAMSRLIEILSNSEKVEGIERINAMMASYGIDDVELDFRDLEVDVELAQMKSSLGLT